MLPEFNDCQFKAQGYNFKTLILNERKNTKTNPKEINRV